MNFSLWALLVSLGFGLKVGRNYGGSCQLNETIELEDGLKWSDGEETMLTENLVKLPTRVIVPINHEIVGDRLVFRKAQRISEVFFLDGVSRHTIKPNFSLNLTWGVAPSYGKELSYWRRFFSEMIPARLMGKGFIPMPELDVVFIKNESPYIWFKSVAYEVDVTLYNFADGSKWTITGHFPLTSEKGELLGIYGVDDVCDKSSKDLFPMERDGPENIQATLFYKCRDNNLIAQ